jgi:hypothetical protein
MQQRHPYCQQARCRIRLTDADTWAPPLSRPPLIPFAEGQENYGQQTSDNCASARPNQRMQLTSCQKCRPPGRRVLPSQLWSISLCGLRYLRLQLMRGPLGGLGGDHT